MGQKLREDVKRRQIEQTAMDSQTDREKTSRLQRNDRWVAAVVIVF